MICHPRTVFRASTGWSIRVIRGLSNISRNYSRKAECSRIYSVWSCWWFHSRWDTIGRLWGTDNRSLFNPSIHSGNMGSRVGLCFFWYLVALCWSDYPPISFTKDRNQCQFRLFSPTSRK